MILINEQLVERERAHIDIEDRGYQFGDGLYEVARIYQGKPFLLDEHLVRFERSSRELKITLPMSIKEIKGKILALIKADQIETGIVYFQLTRGAAPRNHAFPSNTTSVLTAYTKELNRPLEDVKRGVKVITVEDIRWLRCDIKSLNLLGNVLAKQQAVEQQAKEAIQIRGSYITEGSSSNFFMVKDSKLYTHPANNLILKGITRDIVQQIAEELKIPFIEKEFTLEEALASDELFLSGTTTEIMPIIQVDDHSTANEPGPITRKLQQAFEKLI